ncbi:hypothetical protein BE17_52200 [Sorangium cellulosum]|uniref:Lipoprotein n=1 Tax=Sorangium cellulosum TaxID=56 RepID=A0A150RNW4_SORCE|nr:hypothetical protein BE17_52200 [Sorangium cellulosum]
MEMPMMNHGSRSYARRLCPGACLALLALTVGCGGSVIGEDDTGPVGGEDDTETPVGQDDTGTTPPVDPGDPGVWPKTVTLAVQGIGELGEHVRLADGTVSDAGDVGVQSSRVIALRSPAADSICEMGLPYAALTEIPTDVAGCSWVPVAYLSGTSIHESGESYRIGLGLLVWDAERATLYRLRVLGDSYDVTTGSTATFEYEPVR